MRRDPHERVRVTASARSITRSISAADVEAYLLALGYRRGRTRNGAVWRKGEGRDAWAVPSPRDARYDLGVLVGWIGALEDRSPAQVLRAIAAHARGGRS